MKNYNKNNFQIFKFIWSYVTKRRKVQIILTFILMCVDTDGQGPFDSIAADICCDSMHDFL